MKEKEQLKILYLGSTSYKIKALYKDERFKVYKFIDPFTASGFLDKEKVHAIICDMEIKHMTGIEYYENFHKCNHNSNCVYILLLEKPNKNIVKTALKKGLDDVYVLPLNADSVYKRISFLTKIKANSDTGKVNEKHQNQYKVQLSKRLFDIVVAASVLLILSPLLLIVMM